MGLSRKRRVLSPEILAERYRRSIVEGRAALRWDRDPSAQAEAFRLAGLAGRARMAAVREFLNRRGVALCLRMPLVNFGRHCEKVTRNYTRRTRAILLKMACDRWTRYGLERELLVSICRDCFGSVPLGEPEVDSPPKSHSRNGLEPKP